MSSITLLGTGTCLIEHERRASSVLLELNGLLILLLQAGAWSRRDARASDLHIYGPRGVQRLVDGLMRLFGPSSFTQPSYAVRVHEILEEHFEIGGHIFDFISLPPAGNHGLRFVWRDKRYAITGDSHFHTQEIAFLDGVDFAIIDAGHLEDEQIVQLAAKSQAKVIMCSHLYREINAQDLQARAANEGYSGTILVGRDLMSFVI